MKKVFFATFVTSILIITGCSNNDDYSFNTVNQVEKTDDVITMDSLLSIGNESFATWSTGDLELSTPQSNRRLSINYNTAYGFSTYTSSGTMKGLMDSHIATYLGVPRQVYFFETLTLYYYLTVPGLGSTHLFSYNNSPNCGIKPTNSSEIEYVSSENGETVTMATKLIHIISDLSGVVYDMWYPRSPSSLEWNYIITEP